MRKTVIFFIALFFILLSYFLFRKGGKIKNKWSQAIYVGGGLLLFYFAYDFLWQLFID